MRTTTRQRGGNLPLEMIDWQRCLISALWKLLPEGQKSITLTTEDQVALVSAFLPSDPMLVVTSSDGGADITFRVCTMAEALAVAAEAGVAVDSPDAAPGSETLQ